MDIRMITSFRNKNINSTYHGVSPKVYLMHVRARAHAHTFCMYFNNKHHNIKIFEYLKAIKHLRKMFQYFSQTN